jgi:uncharacterized protein YyaL (SSP411 family)
MSNALATETSPYLRQHAENPVDWQPWGAAALSQAVELQRPLFVSIGYAACHWCHVMAHESFEDDGTAALLNAHFVCVKVDREERPDLDGIYMEAVQLLTGQGGWPLSVFLTPDQTPFFGGTYWPPTPRHGLPSFTQILETIITLWGERRGEAVEFGARLTERLGVGAKRAAEDGEIDAVGMAEALDALRRTFDSVNGGFGGSPKFPPHCALDLLLRRNENEMSLQTLVAMARGGICDQVGGGFARYTVDATWTVPHFEKMLYDNALLARAYLRGWQRSGDPLLLRTCRETLEFCVRDLRSPDGGFYSSLDADSEGVEGRFYIWTIAELEATLGSLAPSAIAYFGATEHGNFEGSNVLEARGPEPADRAEIRRLLLKARGLRVPPGLDDKRITSWNALMIAAFAEAGAALADDAYINVAVGAAEFVWERMRASDGRLLRTFNDDRAKLPAYLEDHAFLLEGLLTLYEATFDERFFVWARTLADVILSRFADEQHGGFFTSASDSQALIVRRKDLEDHPIPSGTSSAAVGLLRLAAFTGEDRYAQAAQGAVRLSASVATRFPGSFGYVLCAADFQLARVREVALVGEHLGPLSRVVRDAFRPHMVVAGASAESNGAIPLLEARTAVNGRATAYICEQFSCEAPVWDPAELAVLLSEPPRPDEPLRGSGGSAAAPTA